MSSVLRDPNLFSLDRASRDEIALFLAKAALAAGPAVMEEYDRGCSVASKEDGSPVTSADHRAEAIICEYLARLAPMPPVCAEELMAAGAQAPVAERFLLVDPLDGTREFLAGNGEFTINVALVERGARSPAQCMRPRSAGYGSGAKSPSRVKRCPAQSCPARDRGGASGLAARQRAWSLLQVAHISIPSRIPFSKDCQSERRDLRVRRSSFASSLRALAMSIRGSRQRWNGTRRRATRFCARPAAEFSILPDGRCLTAKSATNCATARSSPGATKRRRSAWDIKIIARGFADDKLNLQCSAVAPVNVNRSLRPIDHLLTFAL